MSNPQEADWSQIPPYAIWLFSIAALGWVVGPFLGFHFGRISQVSAERRRARHDFLAVIAAQLSTLKVLPGDRYQTGTAKDGFIVDSVHQMTIASQRFKSFLSTKEWTRLSATLHDYDSHKERRAWSLKYAHKTETDDEFADDIRRFLSSFENSIPKK